VPERDVVEPRGDRRGVEIAEEAKAKAPLAVAGRAAGHVLVHREDTDGARLREGGARGDLRREAPGIARTVTAKISERARLAVARDLGFGEERQEAHEDRRVRARYL